MLMPILIMRKNRSVQHYFVTLDDGMEFDATTIKELKEIVKKII